MQLHIPIGPTFSLQIFIFLCFVFQMFYCWDFEADPHNLDQWFDLLAKHKICWSLT